MSLSGHRLWWCWSPLVNAAHAREVLARGAAARTAKASVTAMERIIVLVGILYAHVAVACRPTMPEGHVDVPDCSLTGHIRTTSQGQCFGTGTNMYR
jgi:hypothetical protein